MDLIRHEKESPFYLAKWTEVWYYLSSRDLLLMLKIFGEHNGEVSSFLLTALIIVVGWNCAGKYYELPDNLQRFLCNILYVSIGWVNRFSALIVFQLIKFYRYSPVSLEKLSKASHSKLLPLWKFLNFLGLQMISCTLSRMQNQLESIFLYRQNPNRDGKLLATDVPWAMSV